MDLANLKIVVRPDEERYFLTVINSKTNEVDDSNWYRVIFSSHRESFYGTFVDEVTVDGLKGISLNGWDLLTLFANEQFNQFVAWDWCEYAETCLAAAAIIEEAILEKEWLPNFQLLSGKSFRWVLPERVKDEFMPAFWEQTLSTVDETVLAFLTSLFENALNSFLSKNIYNDEFANVNKKITELLESDVEFSNLANYFDEQSWFRWAGFIEDKAPFSIGLQLIEPDNETANDSADWELVPFLRNKNDSNDVIELVNDSEFPKRWLNFKSYFIDEMERLAVLVPFLKSRTFPFYLSEDEALSFLTDGSELLLALGIEIQLPAWWQAIKDAQLQVKARVRDSSPSHRPSFVGLDAILQFDWRISMNGVDFSEEQFRDLVEKKRRLIFIKGRWVSLDPKMIAQIQQLLKTAERKGLNVRDLLEQQLLDNDTNDVEISSSDVDYTKVQFELTRQWQKMFSQLSNLDELPSEPVPTSLNGVLRPYQKRGMDWLLFLRTFGFGACLADDMGLGKTIQLIAYLLAAKERGIEKPNLIVCPTSVLGNWQKELEQFAPSLKVHLHYGTDRLKDESFGEQVKDVDIVLTSYALVNNDMESLMGVPWGAIAIDEAQNIKNPGTKQSRAVRKLRGDHHIALTGTPMENRLSELWAIFDFINHGYLGGLSQFQKKFIIPIEKDNDNKKIIQLRKLIRPFLLRRTKQDEDVALNLPDKLEQKEYCPLTTEQAALYEQLVSDTFSNIEKLSGFERKGLILQMLSRLKQLCNHPALYLKEDNPKQLIARSTKLEKLVELVESVLEQGESCLIFTQYLQMGQFIQTVLNKEFGIEVLFLNGSVPKHKRDEMIEQFQNGKFPVLLLSLKAGGTGLNLTAANHVVHYDRWWNPAVENQATDRAYRIGQKRFVHVHKLICTGTLEEKIDAMITKKQALNDEIIQSDNWITELSTEDLEQLITLGPGQ